MCLWNTDLSYSMIYGSLPPIFGIFEVYWIDFLFFCKDITGGVSWFPKVHTMHTWSGIGVSFRAVLMGNVTASGSSKSQATLKEFSVTRNLGWLWNLTMKMPSKPKELLLPNENCTVWWFGSMPNLHFDVLFVGFYANLQHLHIWYFRTRTLFSLHQILHWLTGFNVATLPAVSGSTFCCVGCKQFLYPV